MDGDLHVDPGEPIEIRDPVAELLGVLDEGEPFVVSYADVVKAAGHSCPTAAGSFRVAREGLAALYPDARPVRGEVAVRVGGPRTETRYGVTGRLLSYITGAAGDDGFGGLGEGFGDRRGLLSYGEPAGEGVSVELGRTDTGEAVGVTYRVDDLPPLGEAKRHLPAVVGGTATPEEREAFLDAWHARVGAALSRADLVSVTRR